MNYLIVGLGNIGAKYEGTRHNIGFDVVDYLAEQKEAKWEEVRLAYKAHFRFKSRNFYLIKPTTFMNLSGKAVRYWMNEHKIPLENILVIVDDLAIPYGKLRLRTKGSDGGHNGLKNINELLGTGKYSRLRFGIGDNFGKGKQINFVLGEWSDEEFADLQPLIKKSADLVISYATIGPQRTMSAFN